MRHLWIASLAAFVALPCYGQTDTIIGESEHVTWTCTGSNCPWGTWLDGEALVWPDNGTATRFGYTTSGDVYLPAEFANGITVWIDSGVATLYAGLPQGSSHRALATVSNSNFFDVSGLQPGEVLSIQSGGPFQYQIDFPPPPEPEVPPSGTPSQLVAWNCTGTPCPWGSPLYGHALVWPDSAEPTTARFGYTASKGIYLPSTRANGTAVRIETGSATLYAGFPGASSHRVVATLNAGSQHVVSGVSPGEVLSVQADFAFRAQFDVAPPTGPAPGSEPADYVTWNCTSSPCPWGSVLDGYAVAWDSDAALSSRLGYTTSKHIYLPAHYANGTRLVLHSGAAGVYAGLPGSTSHRLVTNLQVGQEYTVSGLTTGEILSVQSGDPFVYVADLPEVLPPEDPPEPVDVIESVVAYWRCDVADCTGDDWVASVINWPSWAAYPNNARSGEMSRTVYGADGGILYPYMGSWAHGCKVTGQSGTVLIIEWERGTNVWRETWLEPGESHTIQLTSPEDGAMIESADGFWTDFSVALENCTPQPLP